MTHYNKKIRLGAAFAALILKTRTSSLFSASCLLLASVLLYPLTIRAETTLATILSDIAQQEQTVNTQKKQRELLQQQLANQDKIIAEASKLVHNTQITLLSLNKDIEQAELAINELKQQEKQHQDYLAKQLQAAYRLGKYSGLQLLLLEDKKQRGERILMYFNYLNEKRQKVISDLQETQTELTLQQNLREQKLNQQKNLLAQQNSEKERLNRARDERSQTLTALNSSVKKGEERLAILKLNESKLRQKIAQAEREAKARADKEKKQAAELVKKQNQAKQQGKEYVLNEKERQLMVRSGGIGLPKNQYNWPVNSRSILHRFGELQRGELRWKAMIMAAPEGSEVKAVADGIVVMANWLVGYGYVIAIDHGKNDMSLYGYNQTMLVELNKQVKAGEVIGLVGINAEQKQPALYFQIRRQGQAVNPQAWLKK